MPNQLEAEKLPAAPECKSELHFQRGILYPRSIEIPGIAITVTCQCARFVQRLKERADLYPERCNLDCLVSSEQEPLTGVHNACHKNKTVTDVGRIRKADRQRASYLGAKPRNSFQSPYKRKLDGTVVHRETAEPGRF